MEICFYWIDKFAAIEGQGYNFGSQLTFEYKNKTLFIDENSQYIEGFFNLNNSNLIKNVTAICGENGVGKSTFLRALKGLLRDNGLLVRVLQKEKDKFKYPNRILVLKSKGKYKIMYHKDLFSTDDVKFASGEIKTKYVGAIEFIPYGDGVNNMHKFSDHFWRVNESEILSNTSAIYFSHSFDHNLYSDFTQMNRGYFDISTKGILNKLKKELTPHSPFGLATNQPNHLNFNDQRFDIGILKEFYISETKERIKLLKDKRCINTILELGIFPKTVELNLDYIIYRFDNREAVDNEESSALLRSEGFRGNLNKIEIYIYDYIETLDKDKLLEGLTRDSQVVFQTYLRRIIDSYFIDVERFLFFKLSNIKSKLNKIEENEYKGLNILGLLNYFKERIIELYDKENFNFNKLDFENLTESYKEFVKLIIKMLLSPHPLIKFKNNYTVLAKTGNDGGRHILDKNIKTIEISIGSNSQTINFDALELLRDFLEVYDSLDTNNNFIKVEWGNISTGEDTLLNIYSRFFNVKPLVEKRGSKHSNDNVIILLDEIEHSLHPEWQRTLLYKLISFLPYVFSSSKSIQIILATNVPFLIADIPTSNVIYLERFKQKKVNPETGKVHFENKLGVSEKPSLSSQTFAANIHSLLMNNFFMSSTLGQLSETKITDLIENLNSVGSTSENAIKERKTYTPDEIKATIEVIGEPIIKNKLKSMYSSKYRDDKKNTEIVQLIDKFQQTQKEIPDNVKDLLEKILRKTKNDKN
ncbi:hypothetical protein WKH56_08480 [Priestia sp. SB1]|uniref:AAA family ATPase n=1 Tax=Priestia sp. SB1 TaxID=3132359 RepID=UPI00316E2845